MRTLFCADGTAWATVWESRSPPIPYTKPRFSQETGVFWLETEANGFANGFGGFGDRSMDLGTDLFYSHRVPFFINKSVTFSVVTFSVLSSGFSFSGQRQTLSPASIYRLHPLHLEHGNDHRYVLPIR